MNDLEQEIWKEHIEEITRIREDAVMKPDEKTVRMLSEETGITMTQARNYLNSMVEQGKMTVRKINSQSSVYRPVA